jgi:hypothetical protein
MECVCIFLVRNSGNMPGRKNVRVYSSEYDICLNKPAHGDLQVGDIETFEVQVFFYVLQLKDYDGEHHGNRGKQDLIMYSPSKKITKFVKQDRGRYVLEGFKITERGDYTIGVMTSGRSYSFSFCFTSN